jgi:hypothetical protein
MNLGVTYVFYHYIGKSNWDISPRNNGIEFELISNPQILIKPG